MKKNPYYLVDVFAEKKYSGNQLAVFTETSGLTDEEMQSIARETNFAETTFVMSKIQSEGGYDVRIFTPEHEIPFAGHPTLGTAFVIQQQIVKKPVEEIRLNLKVGQIPVQIKYQDSIPNILWMKQNEPEFGKTLGLKSISQILGLEESELDRSFPIEEISTGLPFAIVPVNSLKSVRRIRVNESQYLELFTEAWAKGILVFCHETLHRLNQLHVRVFAGLYGVFEDAATGSANGCLAAYLAKHAYFDSKNVDIRVEQGHEMRRPSLLYLKASHEGEVISVNVGGNVIPIGEGRFY